MNALIWYFLSLFIKTVKMQKIVLSIFEFVHFTRNLSYMALLVFYFFLMVVIHEPQLNHTIQSEVVL